MTRDKFNEAVQREWMRGRTISFVDATLLVVTRLFADKATYTGSKIRTRLESLLPKPEKESK